MAYLDLLVFQRRDTLDASVWQLLLMTSTSSTPSGTEDITYVLVNISVSFEKYPNQHVISPWGVLSGLLCY